MYSRWKQRSPVFPTSRALYHALPNQWIRPAGTRQTHETLPQAHAAGYLRGIPLIPHIRYGTDPVGNLSLTSPNGFLLLRIPAHVPGTGT